MKIINFTLLVYFSLLSSSVVFAGNSNVVANYPAPSGSYNKVVLTNMQGSVPDCSVQDSTGAYINAGLLFLYTDPLNGNKQSLELCTNTGSTKPIPYPEQCFNRFCHGNCNFSSNGNACPTGYTQAIQNGAPIIDRYAASTNYVISSTVCCACNTPGSCGNNVVVPQ